MEPTCAACSIARPLLAELAYRPFSGRVLGLFNRAANLLEMHGRLITLAYPTVGNGPFTIVIPDQSGILERLAPEQPVLADEKRLTIGPWRLSLDRAPVWEPRIPLPQQPLRLENIVPIAKPYASWPTLTDDTPVTRALSRLAGEAATQLNQALKRPQNSTLLKMAVTRLAGLGQGLTPAGDDYLIGVIAALYLTGDQDLPRQIAGAAIPKTTAFSAAFLKAAARGEFVEPWHALAQAVAQEDQPALVKAMEKIARFGASSGRDALAGFSHALFSLTQ
jgi:hypothetical protein